MPPNGIALLLKKKKKIPGLDLPRRIVCIHSTSENRWEITCGSWQPISHLI